MSTISTHVLDAARGRPATGIHVELEVQGVDDGWRRLAEAWTDTDGRVARFLAVGSSLSAGTYRLLFHTRAYFASLDIAAFYPQVSVVFTVGGPPQHYHVPLLLSPHGYTTYRGA